MATIMVALSDNLISMAEVTATEASRNFARLLDAVEHDGDTFTIVRHGRAVARLEPARAVTGREVLEILAATPVDEDWAGELRALREESRAQERDWPE
jgi:prevent-host-death family protein